MRQKDDRTMMCIEEKEHEKKMKQEGKSKKPKTNPKCPTQTRNHLSKHPSNRRRLLDGQSKSETVHLSRESGKYLSLFVTVQDKGGRKREREKQRRVKRKKEHDLRIQVRGCK